MNGAVLSGMVNFCPTMTRSASPSWLALARVSTFDAVLSGDRAERFASLDRMGPGDADRCQEVGDDQRQKRPSCRRPPGQAMGEAFIPEFGSGGPIILSLISLRIPFSVS